MNDESAGRARRSWRPRWDRIRMPQRLIREEHPLRAADLPPAVGADRPLGGGEPPVNDTVQLIAFEPKRLRRGVILLLVILTLYQLAIWLFTSTGHFLFLLLLAWLAAIAMEPAVRWFEVRGVRRAIGTSITMLIGVVALAAVIVMLGGVFSSQIAQLAEDLPAIINDVVTWVNNQFALDINPNQIVQQFNISASQIASFATDFAGGIVGAIGVAFAVLFDLLTLLVFAWYLAADSPRLRRTIASWLPPARQRVMLTVWDISLAKAGGFVASKLILALISAAAHAVFFWIIDLPFWLPLGIFAGFTAQLIPIIGTYIGVAIPAIVAVTDQPIDALWIVAFATVYQQIENYYLTPRVSRATMNIHPAVALGAVFAGVGIWGPIGALIGIPIAAAIIAVLDTYGERYELITEMHDSEPTGTTGAAVPGSAAAEPRADAPEVANPDSLEVADDAPPAQPPPPGGG